MALKIKEKVPSAPTMLIGEIKSLLAEYKNIGDKIKVLDKRKDEIAEIIKNYGQSHGKTDSKGSKYCINDEYVYGKQAKNSIKLDNEKSIDFLKAKGLYDFAVVTSEVVDEDKVEALMEEGKITLEEFENEMCSKKVTYAVFVKRLDEFKDEKDMPEIVKSKLIKGKNGG